MTNLNGVPGVGDGIEGQESVAQTDSPKDPGRRNFLRTIGKGIAVGVAAAVAPSIFSGCGKKGSKKSDGPKVLSKAPSGVSTETEVQAPPEKIENLEKRREIFLSYLNAGEKFAKQTGDKEALAVIAFVKGAQVLTEPAIGGVRVIETPSSSGEQWIAVTPLIAGDESKDPEWERIMKTLPAAGMFLPELNALVMDGITPFSEFTRGMIALHEGRHAQRLTTDKYNWKDVRTFCYEERNNHEFQNRVTAAIGGKAYQDLLDKEVEKFKAGLDGVGIPVGQGMAPRSPYHVEFDEIFGPALSEKDRNYRESSFWIDANFRLLEKYSKGDIADQKALFLKTIYAEDGLLPPGE